MQFKKEALQTCLPATGLVVVIDVIRDFTITAFAFAAGAKSITLAGTVEEDLAYSEYLEALLKDDNP